MARSRLTSTDHVIEVIEIEIADRSELHPDWSAPGGWQDRAVRCHTGRRALIAATICDSVVRLDRRIG
jgi:hypothetical protein